MSTIPESPSPVFDIEAEKEALAHAWAWFAVHSAQRMQSLNYFFIAAALVIAGYGAAFQSSNYWISVAIAVVGIGLTACFWALDRRTSHLIKAAESPIEELEDRLATRATLPSLRLVSSVEKPKGRTASYSQVIRVLMLLILLLLIVAACVGIFHIAGLGGVNPNPTPTQVG